jgi:hypothetical protein
MVLGSSAATTFGLASTLVVFLVLSDEHPQFRDELPLLAVYVLVFLGLTAISALSFVGLARERSWRWWAQAAMWGTLALLAGIYFYTRG